MYSFTNANIGLFCKWFAVGNVKMVAYFANLDHKPSHWHAPGIEPGSHGWEVRTLTTELGG